MTRCYLVRHAQTSWNEANRLQGHSDVPLSPLGEAQARCVGKFFAHRQVAGIFTSGLTRSRQTARAIAAGNGHAVTPVVEEALAEIHLGEWEGLTPEEVNARFDGAYQRWTVQPSAVAIPGAEPLPKFRQRVRQALGDILGAVQGGEQVIVSHGGVIAAALADILGADYDALLCRLRLDNAGVTAVEYNGSRAHILWINHTAHLHSLANK